MTTLSGAQRLLLTLLLLTIIGVLLSLWTEGLIAAIMLTAAIIAILYISRFVWLPPGYGATLVRRSSLAGVFALAASYMWWAPLANSLYSHFILPYQLQHTPWLARLEFVPEPSVGILLFVLAGVAIINLSMRTATTLPVHAGLLSAEFPDKSYPQKLATFCQMLQDDLARTDRQTNWSPEYYVPLKAQVEVRGRTFFRRRVTDLQHALRRDHKTRVFLLLGDPGSGKSVALRKLCTDLLKEAPATGRVPLYLNLREWVGRQDWSPAQPPTAADVNGFVLATLQARGDIYFHDFVNRYYQRMMEHGRFFFVFDSFDEMPATLDEREGSWLLDALSTALYKFVAGAHDSRGLLASRLFRRPTSSFAAPKTLEIRPFPDHAIARTFNRYPSFSPDLLRELFRTRNDLIPLARNPFLGALLGNYVERNRKLPAAEADIYSDYVRARLSDALVQRPQPHFTVDRVIESAVTIAWEMFREHRLGLEARPSELASILPNMPVEEVVDLLCYARLARRGLSRDSNFSFVHRRFAEYFVARRMLSAAPPSYNVIPTDSRWRDALVLYTELASEDNAAEIAAYCWGEMQSHFGIEGDGLRGIHCLRFLSDAFRARLGTIEFLRPPLAEFIIGRLDRGQPILISKLAVEGSGLVPEDRLEGIIIKALYLQDKWIAETALKACRHMARITRELRASLRELIGSVDVLDFIAWRRELQFSLGLSDAFRDLRWFVRLRVWDLVQLAIGLLVVLITSPVTFATLCPITAVAIILQRVAVVRTGQDLVTTARLLLAATVLVFGALHLASAASLVANIVGQEVVRGITQDDSRVASFPVSVVSMILLIPWYRLDFEVLRRALRKADVSVTELFVGIITIGVLLSLLVALAAWVITRTPESWMPIIGGGVIAIVVPFGIWTGGHYLVGLGRDLLLLRGLRRTDVIERAAVEELMAQLRTEVGRLQCIRRMEERNMRLVGQWTGTRFLRPTGDPAFTRLAQLEERSLGLER